MSFFAPDPPVVYRPPSISIIGWYLAISGPMSLVPLLFLYSGSPALDMWEAMGFDARYLMGLSISSGIVNAAAGTAMLKRIAWGRTLYLVFTPLQLIGSGLLLGMVTFSGMIGGGLLYGLVFYLLTRPAVHGYFEGTVIQEPHGLAALRAYRRQQGNSSDLARIFAVITGAVTTVLLMTVPMVLGTGYMMARESPRIEGAVFGVGTVFTGISVVSLLVGTLLWGFRRWKDYVGWVSLVAGVWLLVSSFSIGFMMDPSFLEQLPTRERIDPDEFMRIMRTDMTVMKVGGVGLMSVGAPLVWIQRIADRAGVPES